MQRSMKNEQSSMDHETLDLATLATVQNDFLKINIINMNDKTKRFSLT